MLALFENELRKGTGVPFVLLKHNVIAINESVDQIIIDHIINNTAYDPQCEGGHEKYLYELVSMYEHKDKIFSEIIKIFDDLQYKDINSYDWSEDQIIQFIALMVKDGRYEKDLFIKRMAGFITAYQCDDGFGIEGLIAVSGLNGIIYVAELLGAIILDGKELGGTSLPFFEAYNDLVGKSVEEIKGILLATNNDKIKAYLNYTDTEKQNRPKHKRLTLEEVLAHFGAGGRYPLGGWIMHASDEEIKKLKELFVHTENVKLKYSILCAFDRRKINLNEKFLWQELERTDDLYYKSIIIESLIPFGNINIKKFIDNYTEDETKLAAFKAFISLCDEADQHRIKLELLEMNMGDIHWIGKDILEYEQLKQRSFYPKVLRILYDKIECTNCRVDIVKAMISANCIDNNLLEEIKYDCNEEVRKMAKKV
ncbi:hypothetical protein FACS189462_0550 [Spirochaetia bacterium]|nr:hypothetical protein FACS189462_0550 [Spirochaetia bacterium]